MTLNAYPGKSALLGFVRNTLVVLPSFLLASPVAAEPFAYVTHRGGGVVGVIDTSSNSVVARIPAGIGPFGVAAHPSGAFVYLTNYDGGAVSVLDVAKNEVVATIPLPNSLPRGIAVHPSGSYLYVAGAGVFVIDTRTNEIVQNIDVRNGPFGLAMHPGGRYLYAALHTGEAFAVIDTVTHTVVAQNTLHGAYPTDVVAHPSGEYMYFAINGFPTPGVAVVDTATNTTVARITGEVGMGPFAVDIHPDGSTLYLTVLMSNWVLVIDTATHAIRARVPVGEQPLGISVDPSGQYVYVANEVSWNVSVISTATNQVVAVIPSPGGPVAFGRFIAPLAAAVEVAASEPTTTEGHSTAGAFTITRTGSTDRALTVSFSVGGSATEGTDYIRIGNTVTIPAGENSARLQVSAVLDALIEGDETVTLTLTPGGGYRIGSQDAATVRIGDYTGGVLAGAPVVSFGSVPVGSTSDRRLTVSNESLTDNLIIEVPGRSAHPAFVVGQSGTFVIPPASNYKVPISFLPMHAGEAADLMTIRSSDPRQPTKNIRLRGSGR